MEAGGPAGLPGEGDNPGISETCEINALVEALERIVFP